MATKLKVSDLITKREQEIESAWVRELQAGGAARPDLIKTEQLERQCHEFLRVFQQAVAAGGLDDPAGPTWTATKEIISDLSRSRGRQGFSPSETASFVLSLKRVLFLLLRNEGGTIDDVWPASEMLDRLALFTTEVYQKGREEVIHRQQQEMLELSTPVVKLADNILALPLIGSLDSTRTQVVMESLLQTIVDTGCRVAIIDITGVPTVDTLVAQHLLKTISAARLMGAECIVSGIRPQIAQTMIHLALDLGDVQTKATLADAFATALKRSGMTIVKVQA